MNDTKGVYALDAGGRLKWRKAWGASSDAGEFIQPVAGVSTSDSRFVAAGADGSFYGYWPDGRLWWRYAAGAQQLSGSLVPLAVSQKGMIGLMQGAAGGKNVVVSIDATSIAPAPRFQISVGEGASDALVAPAVGIVVWGYQELRSVRGRTVIGAFDFAGHERWKQSRGRHDIPLASTPDGQLVVSSSDADTREEVTLLERWSQDGKVRSVTRVEGAVTTAMVGKSGSTYVATCRAGRAGMLVLGSSTDVIARLDLGAPCVQGAVMGPEGTIVSIRSRPVAVGAQSRSEVLEIETPERAPFGGWAMSRGDAGNTAAFVEP